MLSEQAIFEFQKIYQRKFNENITFDKAREEAFKLLQVFKVIYKPIKKYGKS